MLTTRIFDSGMNLLGQNYDRTIPEMILTMWREYLDEHLSDEEFIDAVKHAILHSRFMPTASDLVEYVQGSKEVRAIQEWQSILKAASCSSDLSGIAYLSNRAQVALQAIGGLRAVGFAEDFQRQRMEKSFITVYCQCSDKDARALPQAKEQTQAEKAAAAQEESAPIPPEIRQRMEKLGMRFSMNGKGDR